MIQDDELVLKVEVTLGIWNSLWLLGNKPSEGTNNYNEIPANKKHVIKVVARGVGRDDAWNG